MAAAWTREDLIRGRCFVALFTITFVHDKNKIGKKGKTYYETNIFPSISQLQNHVLRQTFKSPDLMAKAIARNLSAIPRAIINRPEPNPYLIRCNAKRGNLQLLVAIWLKHRVKAGPESAEKMKSLRSVCNTP